MAEKALLVTVSSSTSKTMFYIGSAVGEAARSSTYSVTNWAISVSSCCSWQLLSQPQLFFWQRWWERKGQQLTNLAT